MQPLSSNILSINYNSIPDSQIAVNLEEAQRVIESKIFDVIVWHINSIIPPSALSLLQHPASTQLVLIYSNKTEIETFLKMSARFNIFGIYSFSNTYQIKEAVLSAVEKSQKLKQEKVLEGMVQDLNRKLEKSFKDLEERVEKRQAYLLEARKKTFLAQTKWELTRQTLIAIHQGITLHSIESGLMESLKYIFHLKSIRIVLHPLIAPNRQTLVSLRIPLVKNQEILGTVVFTEMKNALLLKKKLIF
jgi:adenylyl- and sulfurtransferase ThiI